MRSIVLFLVGMLLGACGTHTEPLVPTALSHEEAASTLRTMTVALVQPREDGTLRPFCSGVWVADQYILTARHCTHADDVGTFLSYVVHADVYPTGGSKELERASARVAMLYRADEVHDLALLYAGAALGSHGIARTRSLPIVQGMFAQSMGCPLGLWWSYSSGDVSAVREQDFDGDGAGARLWLQTTAPISPGNSGGGLFDENGALIGIAHGSFTRGQGLNLFVHQVYVDALLRAAGLS